MKQFGKTAVGLVAVTALVGTLAACSDGSGGGGGGDDQPPITIRYAENSGPNSSRARAFNAFADEVTKETNGAVQFEAYWSGSLFTGPEELNSLQNGVADMAQVTSTYHPDELPIADWFNRLVTTVPSDPLVGLLAGDAADMEAVMGTPEIIDELGQYNLTLLAASLKNHRRDLLCTKKVTTLQEAQNVRTRVGGEVWSDEAESLGMSIVQIAYGELYEGLQRGLADCAVQSPDTYNDLGLAEVAKHYVPTSFSGFNGVYFVINTDTWNKLTPATQEIFHQATQTYWETLAEQTLVDFSTFAQSASDNGVTFYDPSDLDAALQKYQNQALEHVAELAPSTLSNPEETVQRYLDLVEKWTKKVQDLGYQPVVAPGATTDQLIAGYIGLPDTDYGPYIEATAELFDR